MVGQKNFIFWKLKSVDPKKKPLTTKIILHFYFPFKVFPENERERERAGDRNLQSAISPSLIAISSLRSRDAVDRDLAKGSRSRSRRRSQSRIAIDGTVVRRCSVSSLMIFSWVVACVFLDLCFPSSFPNTRKYSPENFLKCNQTPWKHFPFPEISISGKYVFSGKRFPATKHSLIYVPLLSQDPLGEAYGL